ncbi:MAG: hypothetical protein OXL98_02080 [Acidimicrobiaceae bacterium]|nr:hypothetical protein [Acidimicrobiaceae bacterium]
MNSASASVRRDADGNPVWTFRVTDALLQANRRIAFPKQVAAHLGCKPGGLARVAVENPAGCRKLKVCLEQGDTPRTVVLNMAEPLMGIGASREQSVDLVVTGPRRVALRRSGASGQRKPTGEPEDFDTPARDSPSNSPQGPPAPWRSPPTPLLPRWYLDALATVPLPPDLISLLNREAEQQELRVVGDLTNFWQSRSRSIDSQTCRALARLVSLHPLPPRDHMVIPDGIGLVRLLECPLRQRPRNCIGRAMASGEFRLAQPITVGWLLSLQNFGVTSLLEVMCIAEAATDSGFLMTPSIRDPGQPATLETAAMHPGGDADQWGATIAPLQVLLTAAAEFHGACTLGEALACDLGRLIADLRLERCLDDISVENLTGGRSVAEEALAALGELWQSMTPLEQSILADRILASEPLSLQEIGSREGLSRERIRQIQRSLKARLNQVGSSGTDDPHWMGLIVATVRHQAGPVVAENELEERISSAFSRVEVSETNTPVVSMARQLLRKELGYTCDEGVCLDDAAYRVVEDLKESARRIADGSGLIDEGDLRDCLPGSTWQQHWPVLLARCGLLRLSGLLALRDTSKARARAALISIGRPATKEEVAQQCGLDATRAAAQLSAMDDVVRADMKRWGLSEWIDDEYEGIAAEIVQRIQEDGGATRLARLLEELPRKFGVSESSVRAYVATPKFLLADGYVSIADPSSLTLRPLADAVHGYTADERPYWRFRIESRYFDGYSVGGLPPEIAKALGCEPDGRTRVPISEPAGCRPISANWPLASVTGANVGYLSEPLRRLGARSGQSALLVIDGAGSVSLQLEALDAGNEQAADSGGAPSSERARDLLKRMKNRRKLI